MCVCSISNTIHLICCRIEEVLLCDVSGTYLCCASICLDNVALFRLVLKKTLYNLRCSTIAFMLDDGAAQVVLFIHVPS